VFDGVDANRNTASYTGRKTTWSLIGCLHHICHWINNIQSVHIITWRCWFPHILRFYSLTRTSKKCTNKEAEDGEHLPGGREGRKEPNSQQEQIDTVQDASTTKRVCQLACDTRPNQRAHHLYGGDGVRKMASVTNQVPLEHVR